MWELCGLFISPEYHWWKLWMQVQQWELLQYLPQGRLQWWLLGWQHPTGLPPHPLECSGCRMLCGSFWFLKFIKIDSHFNKCYSCMYPVNMSMTSKIAVLPLLERGSLIKLVACNFIKVERWAFCKDNCIHLRLVTMPNFYATKSFSKVGRYTLRFVPSFMKLTPGKLVFLKWIT